jgi:anti-sigma regulatory factor (Ser/Thr protein kinase)
MKHALPRQVRTTQRSPPQSGTTTGTAVPLRISGRYGSSVTGPTQTFPPEPASVRAARRWLAAALSDRGLESASDAAASLVSELATNCVIHARTPFTVDVAQQGDVVRVSVSDSSPVQARMRSYGLDSTTGRGLRLVASLASTWGVEGDRGGKTVWFEVPAGTDDRPAVPWGDENMDAEALLSQYDDDAGDQAFRARLQSRVAWAA